MRGYGLGLLLLLLVGTLAGQAQTTYIINDGFESSVLNTTLWGYREANGGVPPYIVPDGTGYVLKSLSSGGAVTRIGALYTLPAFSVDDVLVAQLDLRRDAAGTWVTLEGGAKRPYHVSGGSGSLTTITSYVGLLPALLYHPGVNGDPFYPHDGTPEGFSIQVVYQAPAVNYLADGGPLTVGQWYDVRWVYSPTTFTLALDGQQFFSLADAQLPYAFDQTDDWLFLVGDGGSKSYCVTNTSIDNILLIHTKQVILDITDAFPNEASLDDPADVAVLDGYYSLFGPETLQAALIASQGSWEAFLSYLFPPEPPVEEPTPEPRLVLVSLTQDGSMVTLVVRNEGDGPCEGDGRIVAGLSYCTAWVPEWATWFLEQDLGPVTIAPGDTMTVTFDLPAVPDEAQAAFETRLKMLWTDYSDPDPADYIGIHFSVLPGSHVFGFLPMP